jgi:hypothetical protein
MSNVRAQQMQVASSSKAQVASHLSLCSVFRPCVLAVFVPGQSVRLPRRIRVGVRSRLVHASSVCSVLGSAFCGRWSVSRHEHRLYAPGVAASVFSEFHKGASRQRAAPRSQSVAPLCGPCLRSQVRALVRLAWLRAHSAMARQRHGKLRSNFTIDTDRFAAG